MSAPVLYVELSSPYAYLAFSRAREVLGTEPEIRPFLLGPVFKLRGHGSWGHDERREAGQRECERREVENGLPPMAWPDPWPGNSLNACRVALWAPDPRPVVAASYEQAFARGRDIFQPEVLADIARAAGLDPDEALAAVADPAVKQLAREATEAAWAAGVRGAPTTAVGDELFFGDDQLPAAAAALVA